MDVFTKELALKVNICLKEYIDVQNSLFKFSFKKVFGLEKKDPLKAMERVKSIEKDLLFLKDSIRGEKPSSETVEGQFLITMRAYIRTMEESMAFFCEICKKMLDDSGYGRKKFKEDLRAFQLKEADYLEIGQKLNEQIKLLKATAEL